MTVGNHQGWKNPRRSRHRPLVYVQKTQWTKEGLMSCHVIFKAYERWYFSFSTFTILLLFFFWEDFHVEDLFGYLDNSTTMIDSQRVGVFRFFSAHRP